MTKRWVLVVTSLLGLAACSTPAVTAGTDAGAADATTADDAAVAVGWHVGPDLPEPIAFGAAMVLPSGGTDYVYVIGGTDGTFGTLGTVRTSVERAPIQADHSLGAWESAGDIVAGSPNGLAAGGAIRIWGETGEDGVALAGGHSRTSPLPFVLGGYVQFDGTLGEWGRFDPMLTSGQSYGTFNPFEAHQLALIGGLVGTTPSATVLIAAIENGAMSPTWRPGPDLPAPRYGHGAVVMDRNLDDTIQGEIYLVGGANDDGLISDVLRTSRDAAMEVTSWEVAGTLTDPVVFPGIAVIEDRIVLMGGIADDVATGAPTARVRVAQIDPTTHEVGAFTDVPGGALPTAVGAPMVAIDGAYVYLVGGMTGADHAVSAGVMYGRLP
jgi:hypothetical protein